MLKWCPNCEREVDARLIERIETLKVKGEDIMTKNEVYVCSECGEDIWDDVKDEEALERAYAIYRQHHK